MISANTPANLVAKAATSTIPIVFTAGTDPVRLGLVASLSKPGGNITGVTQLTGEVAPKRIELAHVLVPTATEIALLINPTNPSAEALTLQVSRTALAVTLGLQLNVLHANTEVELIAAFEMFKRTQAAVRA